MKVQTVHPIEGVTELTGGWDLYRLIAETATDSIIVIDGESWIWFANHAAQQLFGYGPELLGQSLTILIPERERGRHIRSLDEYKSSRHRHIDWRGVELLGLHSSGREIPVEVSFGEAQIEGKRFFIGYIRDITQRKQQELQARQQAETMAAILETTNDLVVEHDLARLLQTIVERAAGLLNATGGGIYLCEPEEKQVRCVVSYHTPRDYTGTVLKYGEGAAGRVALTGEPLVISDYSSWEGRATTFEKDRPFDAVLSVPLKWRGELLGVLHVLEYGHERAFSEQDRQVVTAFASQAAAAVYNARLIEDVRRRNRILSALQESTLTVISRLDLKAAFQEIITQAAQLLETAHGYISLLDPREAVLVMEVGVGIFADYVGNKLRIGEGLGGKVWQAGQPLVIQDYHRWEGRSNLFERDEFHAVAGIPLTSGEGIVGVLGLAYLEPGRRFTPDDVDLVNRLAALVSIALENARLYTRAQEELAARKTTEAALQESRTRLAGVLESAMDAVISVDSNEHIVLFNAAAERTFRCSAPEALGQPLNRFIPDRFNKAHSEHLRRYGETGLTRRHMGQMAVVTGRRADGHEFPLEASISQTSVSDGNLYTVLLRDVTERQRAEALQAALYEISEAANRAASPDDLYRSLHIAIGKVMSARNFYIALYDAEHDLLSFVYHQDETDEIWDSKPGKPGRGLTEYVLRTGRPLYCDSARFEELLQAGEAELVGLPSQIWLGVPLVVENKTIGVMAAQDYHNADAYGPAELQILEFVSAQAAKAIERTRLLGEVRQHDRVLSALQEATVTLMRELDLEDVLQTILRLAAQLMNTPNGYVFLVEPDDQHIRMRLGLGINTRFVGTLLEPGEGLAGRIWQTGQPLAVADYHTWAGRSPRFDTVPFHALAGVPLTAGAKVIGVLGVDHLDEGYTISSEGVDLLNRFGQLASIAFENARLYQAAQNDLTERKLAEEKLRASEERFRALIEHGADQVSLLAPNGTLLYENPADIRPLGYPPGTFVGQSLFAIVNPEDLARARQTWEHVLAQPGVSVRASFRLRHADGTWRWMEGTATNLLDNPAVGAIVINYRDSTDRLQAEQALRESEARFHSLVEHLPAVTYTAAMDEKHTRLYISPQAETLYGISPTKAIADPDLWRRALHPDDRERVLAEAEQFYRTGRPFVSDYRVVRDDGRVYWFHDEAVIVEDEATGHKFIHGVQVDISQRREAEEEIRRLNAELEQRVKDRTAELEAANKELEAFSFSVSHDLRAPLRAIDGYTGLLAGDYGDSLPEEGRMYLSNIRQGTRNMNMLISDLLALSRVTRQVINYQMVNLSNIVQALAYELRTSAPGRSAEFIIARGLAAEGDPGLLQILMQNLIGNAWKFTTKCQHARIEFGVRPPSPEGKADGGEGNPVFFVRDNGAGFDMKHANTLFRAFQRLHTDAEFEGTGIGLTIVKRIVERHGGKAWAEGEVDKGATFYFTL